MSVTNLSLFTFEAESSILASQPHASSRLCHRAPGQLRVAKTNSLSLRRTTSHLALTRLVAHHGSQAISNALPLRMAPYYLQKRRTRRTKPTSTTVGCCPSFVL